MQKYPQYTVNIHASVEQKSAFFTDEDIRKILTDAEEQLSGDGRIVARPSGTEPVIRIMTEGKDKDKTRMICEEVSANIEKILKNY